MSLLSISSYLTWKGNDETPCKGAVHSRVDENSPVITGIEEAENRMTPLAGSPVEEFLPEGTAPLKPARTQNLNFKKG